MIFTQESLWSAVHYFLVLLLYLAMEKTWRFHWAALIVIFLVIIHIAIFLVTIISYSVVKRSIKIEICRAKSFAVRSSSLVKLVSMALLR
mmetsp:Transcript_14317/g.17266  ORF Transcript_14317/g.17266 Transcript_14317/m.17266 type:complete len:90 (+) Transcript_14317:216-485(+)